MNAAYRAPTRTGLVALVALAGGLLVVPACTPDLETSFEPGYELVPEGASLPDAWITGEVEFAWMGGKGGMGQQTGVVKHAMAEFSAFPPTADRPAKGEFYFRVYNEDVSTLEWTLHREVVVEVTGAYVDVAQMKGWFVGEVTSDIKVCIGGGGESGECDCGGGDGSHDGGCSHDGGSGGCTDSGTGGGTDGCTDGGTGGSIDCGTDGCTDGCTDGGTGGDCGGSGHTGGESGSPSGKDRVGQMIAVKVHDRSTPGIGTDGITWRWFTPATAPSIDLIEDWPHLCKKEILEGNLAIHTRGSLQL